MQQVTVRMLTQSDFMNLLFCNTGILYGGIYDDGKGCALIEFKGNRSGNKPEKSTTLITLLSCT